MGKKRVLITLFLGALVFAVLIFLRATRLPDPIAFDLRHFPTIGPSEAPLEFVAFEDFRCCNCKVFQEKIFPEIRLHYIDSGKARYTLVPLAFLNGSKRLANAALAVYEVAPDRFFPFVEELFCRFSKEDAGREELLALARQIGGIDLGFLDRAMQKELFYPQLERVLEWAKEVMREDFGVPTLYINGIPSSTSSFRAVQMRARRVA